MFNIVLLIYFQREATLRSLFISGKLLYMFRMVSPPIIRSKHNCIYSIWYLLSVIATCLYCGRVGVGLSVVWELDLSVLGRSVQFPHNIQTSYNFTTIEAGSNNG